MSMLDESEVKRLREMMDNFVQLNGPSHPEHRMERVEAKIEQITETLHEIKIGLSNAQLIQKGVLWLGGTIAGSAVIMTMTFLFKG